MTTTSWNQGANSVWGRDLERLPDLDPSEIVPGRYSKQELPNIRRHRVIKILRLYGPLSVGDITRKDTGDLTCSRDRQNQKYYATIKALEQRGLVVMEGGGWILADLPPSRSLPDINDWLEK